MADDARRTFSDYKNEVLAALGNPDASSLTTSAATYVNDALEHLAALHPWRWKSTGQQTLSITADQNYVELPADFGAEISVEYQNNWTGGMYEVDWDTLNFMRQQPIQSWSAGFWYTINTGNVESGQEDAGLTLATLELYPTPATAVADAVSIVYRRFLRRLKNASDRPQWPAYMDRALTLMACHMAASQEDNNPQNSYVAELDRVLPTLIDQDGRTVQSFGTMRGALSTFRRVVPWGYPSGGVGDPT